MKFSVFTVSTPDWTPEQTVQKLSGQGWDGVEWRVADQQADSEIGFWSGNRATLPLENLEEHLEVVIDSTRNAQLEFVGLGGYQVCDDYAGLERMLRAASRAGARHIRVKPPTFRPGHYREQLHAARGNFEWISDRARHHQVKALVELHQDTIISSPSAAIRVLDGLNANDVGVIHDIGNAVIEGHEGFLSGLEILGEYLAHVHVKNAVWKPNGRKPDGAAIWKPTWVPLKSGQVDIRYYFECLKSIGYDDWVSSEDFSTEKALEDRLLDNLEYLKNVAEL